MKKGEGDITGIMARINIADRAIINFDLFMIISSGRALQVLSKDQR